MGMAVELAVYLLTGALAGLLGGLFGIGGGLIIVPVLILVFGLHGVDAQVLTQLAIGTSLAAIVVTAISSTRGHHRRGAVRWSVFFQLAPGLCVGVAVGAWLAHFLPGARLQLLFGLFAVLVAVQTGLGLQARAGRPLPTAPGLAAAGTGIGLASALFGIGGGSLTVPFLSWCNMRMQEAVATSAACGLPIALIGALAYAVVGWSLPGLPAWSTGYVYWPACAGIVLASVPAARIGVYLAHRLPAAQLRRAFALFLGLIGLQFILRNAF